MAQRNHDGRYIQDIDETHQLTEATRAQLIHHRQSELDGEKTAGVQRMKKERRDLEDCSAKVNKQQAAAYSIETALNQAFKKQIDQLSTKLGDALQEVESTKKEVRRRLGSK